MNGIIIFRGVIFTDIKGKYIGPRKIPHDTQYFTLGFTPLYKLRDVPFTLNEELKILSPDEQKTYVCNRAFT